MLKQVEGSKAIADTVAACNPEVICAYPISPQTHIVEGLSQIVKAGTLPHCQYINVESEFAAMSVAIGASATGARTYTATASQGLLYMVEAVYNASGLGLPIVMTVANRAIGGPINIWNDHSDSMSQRDSGWIQLYAESNQEAADLHVQAFRIAEKMSLPVMVCMDGFILTHAFEEVDIPTAEDVSKFLPPFLPRQVLDPDDPVSIGAMVGPEAFTEVKYLNHIRMLDSLQTIKESSGAFKEIFGRDSGGTIRQYQSSDSETVVVALGSILGTIKDLVDVMRNEDISIGVVGITSFRPFPYEELRLALSHAKKVIVLEKAFQTGVGGIVTEDVDRSLAGLDVQRVTVIAGLGGRPITTASLRSYISNAIAGNVPATTFLDLDEKVVEAEIARERGQR
jgi:pyruvate ferredoxin oxidoreductase alpha subunit